MWRVLAKQTAVLFMGKHEVRRTAYPDWVTEDVRRAAEELTENEAASLLPAVPRRSLPKKGREGRRTKRYS